LDTASLVHESLGVSGLAELFDEKFLPRIQPEKRAVEAKADGCDGNQENGFLGEQSDVLVRLDDLGDPPVSRSVAHTNA
jgi:hypothetical protein